MVSAPLHPDDLLFFNEVSAAMRRVAKKYELPLRSITPLPMPKTSMADRMGDCSHNGDIRLVLRCTVNGEWCDAPMSPGEVWNTAAHELSHLRHMDHGAEFGEFMHELEDALRNQQPDHKAKVIDKLVKMQATRQSEAEIGNIAASEAFATAINRMMLEYELNPSDLDFARATDKDPIVEIRVNLRTHGIKAKQSRIAWQESLAAVVARAHLCSLLIVPGSNVVLFVGTTSHATVAEYVYGILVPAADKMATTEYYRFESKCRAAGDSSPAQGYRGAWLNSFVARIAERFNDARKQAVAAAPAGSESTALLRLEGSLVKVRKYIDDKFKSRKGAASLSYNRSRNDAGSRAGRAAADRMVLGQKGVSGGTAQKQLS